MKTSKISTVSLLFAQIFRVFFDSISQMEVSKNKTVRGVTKKYPREGSILSSGQLMGIG